MSLGLVWSLTRELVAVKMLYVDDINRQVALGSARLSEDPMQEIACMQYMHRGANAADPLSVNVMASREAMQDARYVYSVMPYVTGGELFDRVKDGRFAEPVARYWFRQILQGVLFMQKNNVCHRDMSLENTMINHETNALIIDMGMSLMVPTLPGGTTHRTLIISQCRCGKANYMSPEVYRSAPGDAFDGFAIDIWASGIMLFLMLTGVPPFDVPDMSDQRFAMVAQGRLAEMLHSWQMPVSPDAAWLLQHMLMPNPADRLSLAQVFASTFVTTGEAHPQAQAAAMGGGAAAAAYLGP